MLETQQSNYSKEYEEIKVIGQGSFGSATLVRLRSTGELQVAKKILLRNLGEKESKQAFQEVEILKQLNHPNIVQYKGTFMEKDLLIILMEYCEEGDLQYHIKQRIKGNKIEYFPEYMILNWFIQLLFALEFVHMKKIFHRDIKTNNIFLTADGTVKLADFGVSRVLENTLDHASTVAGTPFYLSPEVCQNKPYTFKSDVWALGCVLYELCTLKHAFDAKNIVQLINKIMTEQPESIPDHYSKEVQSLILKLLQKCAPQRPLISEIINLQFIKKIMQQFVINNGKAMSKIGQQKKVVYIEEQLEDKEDKEDYTHNDDTLLTVKSGLMDTQQQKMQNSDASRYTIGDTIMSREQTLIQNKPQFKQSSKQSSVNNTIQQSMTSNKQQGQHQKKNISQMQSIRYPSKFEQDMTLRTDSQFVPFDSGIMEEQIIEDEYPEDFEDYPEDFEDIEEPIQEQIIDNMDGTSKEKSGLISVLDIYKNELAKARGLAKIEEVSESQNSSYFKTAEKFRPQVQAIEKLKEKIIQKLSAELYLKAYNFMKQSQIQGKSYTEIQNGLVEIVGKKNMNTCFEIDQLIDRENELNKNF